MTEQKRGSLRPSVDVDALAEGAQFGPYRIVRMLAEGGMGQVYEATHVALNKRVALKVIVPEHASNEEMVARFLREAQATARIQHPSVIDVTDVGEIGGIPFLVMDFLEGEPLTNYIYQKTQLNVLEATDLILPVLAGLEAAHEKGVVHRDIKPDNIFLVRERGKPIRPVLLDFGISKLLDGTELGGGSFTKTSLVVGTPYYIAPEQAQDSKRVDARADVYAIAVVFYEMLTGVVPFSGDSLMSILLRISKGDYIALHQARPEITETLSRVVAKAMAVQLSDRFASANDFARALLPFASPDVRARFDKELRPAPVVVTTPSKSPAATPTAPQAHATSPTAPLGTAASQVKRPTAAVTPARAASSEDRNPLMIIALLLGGLLFIGAGVAISVLLFSKPATEEQTRSLRRSRRRADTDVSSSTTREPEPARVASSGANAVDTQPVDRRETETTLQARARTAGAQPQRAVQTATASPVLPAPAPTTITAATAPEAPAQQARAQWGSPQWGGGPSQWGNTAATTQPPAQTAQPVQAAAASAASEAVPTRAPHSPHAQTQLRFSGDCSPSFSGDISVDGNPGSVRVTSKSIADGHVTGAIVVSACTATGRYELGTSDAARYGVNITVEQGGRSWSVQRNEGVTIGQSATSGHIQVSRAQCARGVVEVRFDNAEIVNANRRSTCRINGTLRTTGSD